jgi:hypothetical protein
MFTTFIDKTGLPIYISIVAGNPNMPPVSEK